MAKGGKITMSVTFEENNRKLIEKASAAAVERGLEAIGMEAVTLTYRKKENRGTPVKTGRLKNSIAWATQEGRGIGTGNPEAVGSDPLGTPPKNTLVIGTNVEYAESVEEGGYGNPGAHMLRNALTDGKDRFEKIMEANLKAAQE